MMPQFDWKNFTTSRVAITQSGNKRNGGAAALKTASGNKANPVRVAKFKAGVLKDVASLDVEQLSLLARVLERIKAWTK